MSDHSAARPSRPPLSRCPRCGRQRRSWRISALCGTCLRETQPDSDALLEQLRERRTVRRQGAFSVTAAGQTGSEQLLLLNPPDPEIPY